ncbi:MAG: RsmB/NOP family class I SAM-dependent RNA methyltransferase [Magnetococcales bacterium]|nr:RsmB/NOP family class I SAM-dependent RNA methyltransferase [Magnetococcales bacterium]
MTTPLADHALLVLQRFHQQPGPLDLLLDLHFREHGQLGARDRRWIRQVVYEVMRHRRWLAYQLALPEEQVTFSQWIAAAAEEKNQQEMDSDVSPAVRHSLPDWFWEKLQTCWQDQALPLAAASNRPASVDLRVHRISREKALQTLNEAGIAASATPYSPDGIRLVEHQPLHQFPLFQSGALEIQDEGSQLISRVVAPLPGETVVDLCAGAGGKTLHLASLMKNKGRLLASDQSEARLSRLLPRARRAGVRILSTLPLRHERDPKLAAWAGKAQRVLVDAPCSGSGTLRRNPEIKWRLTPDTVAGLPPRQHALLEAGAALVAVGGRLVYATCSLFCEENRQVVEGFLQQNPQFRLLDVVDILTRQGVAGLPDGKGYLSLAPHVTASDGFFVAALQRLR